MVRVPVLSSTTTLHRPDSSRDWAVLYMIPFLAPMLFPIMMETGVARPNAQGQLMTNTEMALAVANPRFLPASSQPAQVRSAVKNTTGTKVAATRSAVLDRGALVVAASETIWMILARVVSSPTLVALKVICP